MLPCRHATADRPSDANLNERHEAHAAPQRRVRTELRRLCTGAASVGRRGREGGATACHPRSAVDERKRMKRCARRAEVRRPACRRAGGRAARLGRAGRRQLLMRHQVRHRDAARCRWCQFCLGELGGEGHLAGGREQNRSWLVLGSPHSTETTCGGGREPSPRALSQEAGQSVIAGSKVPITSPRVEGARYLSPGGGWVAMVNDIP